jgi:uncharacterized protein YdeI (YjbR/CyaY-like superfamily)
MKPTYFATAAEFRDWLKGHHGTADELWMGVYKKGSGIPSITWSEAVDEALCYGWVDSIRKAIDDRRYMNRFTPRKPNSNWSEVNVRRVEELIRQRRMRAPGLKAFEARTEREPGAITYERRHEIELPPVFERTFRARRDAWAWFQAQPPGYRSMTLYWLMSAKKPETRERRLAALIDASANGVRVGPLARPEPGSR